MQAAAKQFRGDFFVAIDQPVGKFVRIEAPFLNGDVGVRGDAIAMPAVRNGRKGLVVRLVKLDADSLGIPIQEATKELSLDKEEDDDDGRGEFDAPQATVASPVSAAVAKSIRASAAVSDRAQPVKLQPLPPGADEDLDDDAREAVSEFGDVSTRASTLSEDLAKKLAEPEPAPLPHTIKRTPKDGVAPLRAATSDPKPDATPPPDDDAGLDSAFSEPKDDSVHAKPTTKIDALKHEPSATRPETLGALTDDDDDDDDEPAQIEDRPVKPEPKAEPQKVEPAPAAAPSKAATGILVVLILLTIGAAAFVLMQNL